jgi:seryl-tRNA synthetase
MKRLNEEFRIHMMNIPNMLHESVPLGKDDTENVEVKREGELKFDFEPKNHVDLLNNLGLFDEDRATKTSGSGFVFIKEELALLDYSLMRFSIDFLRERGFILVEPPYMLTRQAYEGVTSLEDFESVMYKIDNEDLYLIATSEHALGAKFMNETLDEMKLPLKLAGVSPCFRREIGSHGKYTKGLFRMHQFNKIEQFVFSNPEDSWALHEEIQQNSEELLRKLGIAFRTVNVCTGDIGSIAAKKYDIEFLMADSQYREIGSNSNCTDYQARRLNVKYREKEGMPAKGFVHTLNNTAIATSRAMIAIIEQFQREDGSITIPDALQPYTGFKEIVKK